MAQFVVLLRGINVGGGNIIKMADLRACLELAGFTGVTTYIQSGNVIVEADTHKKAEFAARVNNALAARFNYRAPVFVISSKDMHAVVAKAPKGFGSKPDLYRYDVIFLREPMTVAEAMQSITVKDGVDTAHAGPGVIYFSRLIAKATQSQLNRIILLPVYKSMTIRNWNTTTKLASMIQAE